MKNIIMNVGISSKDYIMDKLSLYLHRILVHAQAASSLTSTSFFGTCKYIKLCLLIGKIVTFPFFTRQEYEGITHTESHMGWILQNVSLFWLNYQTFFGNLKKIPVNISQDKCYRK